MGTNNIQTNRTERGGGASRKPFRLFVKEKERVPSFRLAYVTLRSEPTLRPTSTRVVTPVDLVYDPLNFVDEGKRHM